MIKRNSKKLIFIMLSIMIFGLWGSGIYFGQFLKSNYQAVSIRLDGDRITKKALVVALENEKLKNISDIPVITAWNSLSDQQVENAETGMEALVHLLEISGDVIQVYPIELTDGGILCNDDYNGCLIDEKTAFKLFGNTTAAGCFITYGKIRYCIRGVIKAQEPMVLIQIPESNHTYSNLELAYNDKDNGELMADEFLRQNLLSFKHTIINGCFFAKIMIEISKLPAWLLGSYMIFQLIKIIWKRRTLPVQALLLLPVIFGVSIVLGRLVQFRMDIPQCLIPTKWSDFSFWTEKLQDFLRDWKQISYIMPQPKDMIFVKYVRQCFNDSMAAAAGIILFIGHRNIIYRSRSSVIETSVLLAAAEALAVIILFYTGKQFHIPTGYLYLIPIYILAADANQGGTSEYCRYHLIQLQRIF